MTIIHMCVIDPDEPFVTYVNGSTGIEILQEIEKELKDNWSIYKIPESTSDIIASIEFQEGEPGSPAGYYLDVKKFITERR
jgi:hypothetical protein